jgi:hypothetical protein
MAKKQDETIGESGDMSLDDLEKVLGATSPEPAEETATSKPQSREELEAKLKEYAAQLTKAHTFKKGQLVTWKKGLKNRRNPAYGNPVIVVEVLSEPVFDTENKGGAGSSYFREPLTLVAGRISNDGDFVCFHYDGRRMEEYVGKSGVESRES